MIRKSAIRRTPIKRKGRSASEYARIYGSPSRVKFVKSLPCCACGVVGWSVNAHLTPIGEKGTGYKGHHRFIAPLCNRRGWFWPIRSCHILYDDYPSEFQVSYPDFDPEKASAETQRLWLEHIECLTQ